MNKRVTVVDHPLVKHKLSLLRSTETGSKQFRELISELSLFVGYEGTRSLKLTETKIMTPLCEMETEELLGKKLALIPILRAGLGMVEGMLELVPAARVGHLGMFRDPDTHQPVEYYAKLPADIADRDVLVIDPMLATGGSAAAAIEYLRNAGAKSVKLLVIIAAPEGIDMVLEADPEVEIYTCCIDERLNENAYIVPGLGDAGDRIYGTKG